jgi:multiple sugar transport system ATP-binding protein
MAFGLKMRKFERADIERRVREAAEILGIQALLARKPRQLSGGQRQRVALGRAIVRNPRVFLFDEPLSNLDAKLRVQMRVELKRLHERLSTTAIYVTHDQVEAMTLGDRVVVMKDGVVQQVGEPLQLYGRPANRFVASFIGSPAMNFIDATLRRADGSAVAVAADGTRLPVPPDVAGRDGQPIVYGIRPEHLEFVPADQGLSVDVVVVEPTGAETLVVSRLAGTEIEAVFRERHRLNPGDRISLAPQLGAVHVFDKATGQRLVA